MELVIDVIERSSLGTNHVRARLAAIARADVVVRVSATCCLELCTQLVQMNTSLQKCDAVSGVLHGDASMITVNDGMCE